MKIIRKRRLFVVLSKQRKEWFGHLFDFWDCMQLEFLMNPLNERRVIIEIAFSKVFHGVSIRKVVQFVRELSN